jgi:tetraacyldisaccharide 4'-kinase
MRAPDFWDKDGSTAKLVRHALRPLANAYGNSVANRAAHASGYRATAKVVCVGNLMAGGTGKTPIAIAIARALLARDKRVCFLTRGYGGHERGPLKVDPARHLATDVGDEALLLATVAPVIMSRDRGAGGKIADAQGSDVIVMDDGHQNFSLVKDFSLVVIDSETGFGNGCVLPAGPLREPVRQGLARADAIVIVGHNPIDIPVFGGPILRARLLPVNDTSLAGDKVIAFAGIGRPEKFFAMLRGLMADLVGTRAFPDHHLYKQAELNRLRRDARARSATLITTEKDFVRLPPSEREGIRWLPVRAEFDDTSALSNLLDRIAARPLAAAPV